MRLFITSGLVCVYTMTLEHEVFEVMLLGVFMVRLLGVGVHRDVSVSK
jgi:hypothetical protein